MQPGGLMTPAELLAAARWALAHPRLTADDEYLVERLYMADSRSEIRRLLSTRSPDLTQERLDSLKRNLG